MKLEIFAAECRSSLQRHEIRKFRVETAPFYAEQMKCSLCSSKSSIMEAFDDFVENWNKKWHSLVSPQAGVVFWNKEELSKDFFNHFSENGIRERLLEQCESGCAAVWSIGGSLEEAAEEEASKSAVQAMLLDVAGTLCLGIIRKAIQNYVAREFCAESGSSILGEYIPDSRSASDSEAQEPDGRLTMITEPWLSLRENERPAFSVNRYGVMTPLKTQCSMYFIGKAVAERPIRLNAIPCSNCRGARCLYAQFNGCHLPKDCQPWLKELGR